MADPGSQPVPRAREGRQPAASVDARPNKAADFIWFLTTVVVVIIAIRFLLLLFGAKSGVPFVDFWYGLSAPFVMPFAGIFGTLNTFNSYSGVRIEPESLVAIIIYASLAYVVILGIRLVQRNIR